MNNALPDDQVQEMINSTLPFEEIGWLQDDNVKFSSVEEEDGKTLYVLEYIMGGGKAFTYFDSNSGLKIKQTSFAKTPDGSELAQTTYFNDYREVNGVLFPYVVSMPLGPQNLEMKIVNLTINPQVSDADFTIEK